MRNIILIFPFLFLVTAPLNASEWKKLDMNDAEISVTGEESFITKRSYTYTSTSNTERINFSGGALYWTELNTNVYWGDGDLKSSIIDNFNNAKYFSKHVPLNVRRSDLKFKDDDRQGYYWISQEGKRVSCLWSSGEWGVDDAHHTGGNNRIVVIVCRPGKQKPLEEFLHDLMRRVQIDGGAINKMKAAGNYNASKKQTKIKKEVTKEQPRPTKMRPSKVDVTHPNMLEKNIATLKRTNTCPNCYLKGANLGHKDGGVRVGFYGIDLNDANLRSANLQNINLQGAYLRRADLMGANLKGANLRGADLSGTNLRVANLYMAKFQGANLQGAKLDPEGIRIARTSGAINIPEATFMAKNQTLKPCPGTYKSTWNNCIGTRTYSDKAVYKGPWKSGKQHGQGTLTYLDGEKYVGSFKDGLHHGEGTITYPSGKVMKGIWENDKFKSERK